MSNRTFEACKYLKDYFAQKKIIPICADVRDKLHFFGDGDVVYVYQMLHTAIGESWEIVSIDHKEILRILKNAGFHGNFWWCCNMLIIEVWDHGSYNY